MQKKTLAKLTVLTTALTLGMATIPEPASAWPGWREYKLSNLTSSDWTNYCKAKGISWSCYPTFIHTHTKVCDWKHPGIDAYARNSRMWSAECWDSYWSWW